MLHICNTSAGLLGTNGWIFKNHDTANRSIKRTYYSSVTWQRLLGFYRIFKNHDCLKCWSY